ncbi:P-loop containing nucleoside triphosphate hydrolase protein [Stachybotrys elegans]|uniref:P-loop containing nucleoside triphosphate hydrolase protein n=1 Tax=Stachybotrys elegans TaxID=80388 RepID=A0A8K0SIN7_9HYPO|nr:P-loop containing nucleoside triphosphate hydrolase protein [Stachybotrys elegans]
MVDHAIYAELHQPAVLDKIKASNPPPFDLAAEEPPEAPHIYALPSSVKAFHLRSKKWVEIGVDFIENVTWNKDAFKSLVADSSTKELIQALVSSQLASEKGTDLIEDKGNGLIMLLHGSPGTGKTYTAESVAEIAEKPLYPVTCGDIGTTPEHVERYLQSIFHLGNEWGCVVLLDEAEVFLEQRNLSDLARNALVSVFLRSLEYYNGILILTTNRVGTFDEAFKSRIQLALHYEALNFSQRKEIWTNFFTRLKLLDPNNIDFEDINYKLEDLAEYEMNGRQIRNSITTARQLAQFRKVSMRFTHLEHAIKVAQKFDVYLRDVQAGKPDGKTAKNEDEEIARMSQWR